MLETDLYAGVPLHVRHYDGPGSLRGEVSFGYGIGMIPTLERVSVGSVVSDVGLETDDDGLLTVAGDLAIGRDSETGAITSTTLDGDGTTATNVYTRTFYNEFGDVERVAYRRGAEVPADLSDCAVLVSEGYRFCEEIGYDTAGRIQAVYEMVVDGPTGQDTNAWTYAPDALGRLAEVRRDGALAWEFEYGPNGNRTLHVVHSPTSGLPALDLDAGDITTENDDRLTVYGAAEFEYLPTGHLAWSRSQSGAERCYTYGVFGGLRAVSSPTASGPDACSGATPMVEYDVDPSGRRVARRAGGAEERYLYRDGLNVVAVLDASDQLVQRFVYGSRAHVPDYMVTFDDGVETGTYRLVTDIRGSVRLVIEEASGEVVQRTDYGPYGEIVDEQVDPGFSQPFGYAGGLYDPTTGLVRFGARDYWPELGRWTAKDPIGFAGGDWNVYAYVGGDPVNLVDPSGLVGDTVARAAGWFVGKFFSLLLGTVPAGERQTEDLVSRENIPVGADSESNALLHCTTHCTTARWEGVAASQVFGAAYEVLGEVTSGSTNDSAMDLYNNAMGCFRAAPRIWESCSEACYQLSTEGRLVNREPSFPLP